MKKTNITLHIGWTIKPFRLNTNSISNKNPSIKFKFLHKFHLIDETSSLKLPPYFIYLFSSACLAHNLNPYIRWIIRFLKYVCGLFIGLTFSCSSKTVQFLNRILRTICNNESTSFAAFTFHKLHHWGTSYKNFIIFSFLMKPALVKVCSCRKSREITITLMR